MSKFGVREICDVVLKAKAAQKIGNKIFYANEPVIYFDTLKTSSLEAAADSVYAQGGKGNPRLIAWDGNRTVTFNMEDALISAEGFMILSGAGLVEASEAKPVYQHQMETTDAFTVDADEVTVYVSKFPHLPTDGKENYAYVMAMKNGEPVSEPFIPTHTKKIKYIGTLANKAYYEAMGYEVEETAITDDNKLTFGKFEGKFAIKVAGHTDYVAGSGNYKATSVALFKDVDQVLVDYYTPKSSNTVQLDITADKFAGNYYLEGSTLFRNTAGVDMPAEIIIPNCKIQSNFTFSMAADGDPSTFSFVMDAFPDYTRFDKSKKVLAAIQIIDETSNADMHRLETVHTTSHEAAF